MTAPVAVGAKVTVNDVLWPAERVSGKVRPLRLNPVPLAAAAEIVRLDPPVLVRVSDRLVLLPVCTLPKARLVGFGDSVPWVAPVPESGMDSVALLALELMVKVPLAAPAAVGVKTALKVALCPALSVAGRPGPVKLNPLPLAAALLMVTLSPPLFVTVTGTVLLLPTVMVPKLTLLGLGVSVPGATPVPDSAMLSGEFDASDTMLNVPLALAALAGSKTVLKVTY